MIHQCSRRLRFNQPPRYTTFADPVPAEGEKPVTVAAAGLHQIVKSLANGTHYGSTGELPFIPGVDGVGRLEDGKRVILERREVPYGTFARAGAGAGLDVDRAPRRLDDVTAAGIANPGMSSWVALTLASQIRRRRECTGARSDRGCRPTRGADLQTPGRAPRHRRRAQSQDLLRS